MGSSGRIGKKGRARKKTTELMAVLRSEDVVAVDSVDSLGALMRRIAARPAQGNGWRQGSVTKKGSEKRTERKEEIVR